MKIMGPASRNNTFGKSCKFGTTTVLFAVFLYLPTFGATIESAQSGAWNLTSTWVGGVVPGASDDVIIKANHSVNLSDNRSCTTVTIESSATLTLAAILTQSGAFLNQGTLTWTTGSFTGTGSITNDGILNIENDNQWHNTSANITNNSGKTINWNAGGLDNSAGGQVLTNYGTFNLIGNNTTGWTTQMAIVNKSGGSIIKGGSSSANLTVAAALTNELGGTVTVSSGASLTFSANVTNDGTFTVAGTVVLNGGSHTFGSGGSFGGSGTLNMSLTSTVTASGGFSPAFTTVNHTHTLNAGAGTALNIPSGTTWNWTTGSFGSFTSITNDGTLNLDDNGQFHNTSANITNNAGKTINWNAGGLDNSAGGQVLTNYGTFNLIGDNPVTWTTQMTIINKSGGNIVKGGSSSTNLNISQPFTNETGGIVTVNSGASLTFSGAGTLSNSGAVTTNGTVTIAQAGTYGGSFEVGNGGTLSFSNASSNSTFNGITLTNNGTVSVATGRSLVLGGASQQTLGGNGTSITAITLNNSNGLLVTGSQTISTLALTSGMVFLQDGDLTVSSLTGADASRYIVTQGVGKLVQAVTSSAKLFPVGPSTGSYNPVFLQQVSGTASFGVSVKVGFDYPTNGSDYVNRQWTIDNVSGTPNTNVTLQWNSPGDESGSFTANNCHISRWNGTGWASYGDGPASCGGTCTRTVNGVTAFSPFGVGSGMSLPVELVSFRGEAQAGHASLVWETASELNNEGFHIEKSTDGRQFEAIGFAEGAGTTSEPQRYQFLDREFKSSAYYRLRQVDFDGKAVLSTVIYLISKPEDTFYAYPNPAANELTVKYPAGLFEQFNLILLDFTGSQVFATEISDNQAGEFTIDLRGLSPGMYVLKVYHHGANWSERILVRQ